MENRETHPRQSSIMQTFKSMLSKAGDQLADRPSLIIISVLAVLLLVAYVFALHTEKAQAKFSSQQNQAMVIRLADIQSALQKISDTLPDSAFKSTLQQLTDNVSTMDKTMLDVAKTVDIKQLATQLTDIKKAIDDLQKSLSASDGQAYADSKLLPFQITAIDVISGQPFVTVIFDHHVWPMGVGDTMAGWQLVAVDYEAGVVEFLNGKGQRVKVSAG